MSDDLDALPDEVDLSDEQKAMLGQLGIRPEWEALRAVAPARMVKHFRALARMFMSKDQRPDYDELQWQRGFFAGMKHLLDNPTLEAKRLARALENDERTTDA